MLRTLGTRPRARGDPLTLRRGAMLLHMDTAPACYLAYPAPHFHQIPCQLLCVLGVQAVLVIGAIGIHDVELNGWLADLALRRGADLPVRGATGGAG